MWTKSFLALPLAATLVAVAPQVVLADAEDTVEKSTETFIEIVGDADTRIPAALLQQSVGIAIIPDVAQGGFIVGGRHGKGVILARNSDGTWSNPAFLSLSGGSIGLQVGGRSSDVIIVFPTQSSMARVLEEGEVDFGGSVTGVAGPVGEEPVDSIGDNFDGSRVYTYTRSSGLFGGVSLEGGSLDISEDRIEDFYGDEYTAAEILTDSSITAPASVVPLQQALSNADG